MAIKLYDSELKIMSLLWANGDMKAKDLAGTLAESVGWSKTTTYTVIKKCIDKGAVSRSGSSFICHSEISREEVQESETAELIDKMYDGVADKLVASLLGSKKLSEDEISRLKKLVEELK